MMWLLSDEQRGQTIADVNSNLDHIMFTKHKHPYKSATHNTTTYILTSVSSPHCLTHKQGKIHSDIVDNKTRTFTRPPTHTHYNQHLTHLQLQQYRHTYINYKKAD